MVTVFVAPQSYTGEHMVELSTHGGAYVPGAVCAALVAAGARAAGPGEFTERAVLNGKFDLLRAEAVADLIEARSQAAHRMALNQVSGGLSRRLSELRMALVGLEALLAYEIDFPGEANEQPSSELVVATATGIMGQLDTLLATVPAAILGRDGATVVLAGLPNVGKSSLFNAILGEERVIVSERPGTTRDAVEAMIERDPWPLRLVDTAGLRSSDDAVERRGIEIGERYMASAHVIIACADSVSSLATTYASIRSMTKAAIVGARTKADLISRSDDHDSTSFPVVRVSTVTGRGIKELLEAVTGAVRLGVVPVDDGAPMINRARHRMALETAHAELELFRVEWLSDALPAPIAALHVRVAIHALDELIGAVDVEEVFAQVFATFCVGK